MHWLPAHCEEKHWLSQDTGLEPTAKDGEGYTSRDSIAVKVSGTSSFFLSFFLSCFFPLMGGERRYSTLKQIPIWIVHLHYSSIHFRGYFCYTVEARSAWMFGRYICYFSVICCSLALWSSCVQMRQLMNNFICKQHNLRPFLFLTVYYQSPIDSTPRPDLWFQIRDTGHHIKDARSWKLVLKWLTY